MITVYESTGLTGRTPITEVATFAEAEAFVRANYPVIMFEADEAYPDCGDAYTANGLILCVQPTNFKLEA